MANKKKRSQVRPASAPAISATLWHDALALTALAAMALYFIVNSWLKWLDPLIDFGRELYLPWRITQGAVLYKDVEHLYGPFSPYLNSVFFRLGGVSLVTLITANLFLYSATLALLYFAVRAGWGRWAAVVSSAFFIGVFSFSHLTPTGNYNFLAPYSHEMTHGTLVLLCLVIVLRWALQKLSPLHVACSGLLAGIGLLLKPEIVFAAALAVLGAIVFAVHRHFRTLPLGAWVRTAVCFVSAGLMPMALATLLFWSRGGFPLYDAAYYANYAWLVVFRGAAILLEDPFQQVVLGLDHPWQNIAIETLWGGGALLFAAALAWGVNYFGRTTLMKKVLLSLLLVGTGIAFIWVPWMNVGRAFPGILLGGAVIEIIRIRRAEDKYFENGSVARVLFWIAAAAMLARMSLNPRIFHYGFVQAALGGTAAVAILVSSFPSLFGMDRTSRRSYHALMTIVVAVIIGVAATNSAQIYSLKTFQVALGGDRFYAFSGNVDANGLLVEQARQVLDSDIQQNNVRSLLVLPEGPILNYLTRLPSPSSYFFFAPFILAEGRDDEIIQQLSMAPPDRIVVLSRDMREFGIERFGSSREHGQKLVEFINSRYEPVSSFGDKDPYRSDSIGFLVLALKR